MKTFVKVFVGVGLVVLLLRQINLENLANTLLQTDLSFFSVAIAFFGLAALFEIIRLYILVGSYVGFFESVRLVFLGFFFNSFLPTNIGGDAYKIYLLKDREIGVDKAIALIAFDRMIGLFVLMSLGLIYTLFNLQIFYPIFEKATLPVINPVFYMLLTGIVILVISLIYLNRRFTNFIEVVVKKTRSILRVLNEFPPARYWLQISITLIYHLVRVLAIYFIVLSLNGEVVWHNIIFVLSFVALISALPISFGGLGVREGALTGGLVLLGVAPAVAVGVALINLFYIWLKALIGAFFYLGAGLNKSHKQG